MDNVFLAYEMMDWALESDQDMVMLLLDFKKAYDRVEWDFLKGTMVAMGFGDQWIKWVRTLYCDLWYSMGFNGVINNSFQLTTSVQQGCPLAPFLYLGYLLESNEGVSGILLP
jgi:hypothetical protein